MKGYLVLILVVSTALLLLPVCLLREAPPTPAATQPKQQTFDAFSVRQGETVTTVDADTLTRYTVMGVLSPDAPDEAVKAQAVACYTAFCYAQQHDGEVQTTLPYPKAFCDEYWQEQWGKSYARHAPRFQAAIEAVRGEILTCQGEAILAAYHALNAGKTESAKTVLGKQVPYLVSVGSPLDATASEQLTTVTVSLGDAKETLSVLCEKEVSDDTALWFKDVKKSEAGTVVSVTVCGEKKTGTSLKEAFSLPSAAFEACVQGEEVIFTVHGCGHFLGMSVYGAAAMAENGNTYNEILLHYYPNTTLERA